MKRTLSIVLTVVMLFAMIPLSSLTAFATSNTIISVENVSAILDSTVDVSVSISGNPGIASMGFTLTFDEDLTLVGASNGEAFSEMTLTPPAQLKKVGYVNDSCRFAWLGNENVTENGTILNLKFKVAADAQLNKDCFISITCDHGDVLDDTRTPVDVEISNGKVTIIDYTPGDVDGDSNITMMDVLTLCQFYVDGCKYDPNGYGINIKSECGDVDANGKVNMIDVLMICQYYVDGCKYDPEGYAVKLLPGKAPCEHILEKTEELAPTCTEDGNIAYWHCAKCGEYYKDANASNVISLESTVVKAKGHTIVVDPAVPATYNSTGLTEGSHCSTCNIVITEQKIIPKLQKQEYSIEYYIAGNDEYLASIDIQYPEKTSYTSDEGVDWLEDLVVPGYIFEGWFDGQGSAASRVTSIPVGTARNIKLYAKWTKEVYKITFDNSSMNLPSSTMTYTVDQKVTLEKPTVDRYVFLGWTTDSDKLVSEIKPGTTGNFTLHSNWTSKRNLAKPVSSLGDPIIVENTIEGKILFTYEIGSIENVPLYTIKNLPSAGGVVSVYTETVSKSIGTTDASTVAKAIDHVTTDSTAWTLSEDWNETTHVEDSVLNENGYNRTTGQSVGKTSSNTYTLSINEYDNTVVKANDGTVATTTQYNTNEVNSRATWESKASLSVSDTESVKYTDSAKVSAEVGVGYGPVSAKVGASAESSTEISSSSTAGASAETTIAHENTSHSKTGTDTVTVADNTKTTTTDKGWSKTSNSTSSSSTSLTNYEEETLSERIAKQYTYGQSYAKGGQNSESAAWSTSTGESDQYSSTFTYFNSEETTEGVSYTINGESDGSYRLVRAGIVHVFAVVIYDIANAQYGVTTYSVLDDETYTYIDYSATSAAKFDDNENGVLPFEIPYFVNDYVNGRIVATDGLKYNEMTLSTGEYEGNSTSVIIPEFFSVDNQDDTHSAYAVRYLSADTFSGNTELKSVMLSNYIREIPDYAFAGCTTLQFVYGSEICSIGDYAFDGCTSLGQFRISSTIESIGENAFRGADSIIVEASNKDVVLGAINSGARRITINISAIAEEMSNVTLEIPNTVEYFELQGGRNSFSGLKIKSEAETTVLNGITITASTGIPLEISSETVTLNQVIVESPSYVLLLKSNSPTISLYGTSRFISSSTNAVVCRNVTLDKINSNVSSKLEITGDVLNCGELNNASLISFPERGEIVYITEDDYDKYIKGSFNVSFDVNEGNALDTTQKTVYFGSAYGELPTPTKDYYSFDGWFTAAEGGEEITAETVYDLSIDSTLYAHWTIHPLSGWVLASDAPSDASIENSKWDYILRHYDEGSNDEKSGWITYDSKRTSWGAEQTSYSNPTNGVRNVWTTSESYVSSYTHHYKYYHRRGWGYNTSTGQNGYVYGTDSSLPNGERHNIDLTYALSVYSSNFGGLGVTAYKGYTCSTDSQAYCWFYDGEYDSPNYSNRTLYHYQEPVYTYYYYKDTAETADSDPTGQTNVSNVVKYVQYRAK